MTPSTPITVARVPARRRIAAQLRSLTARALEFDRNEELPGSIVVNFPSMPEEIVFARTAEFFVTTFQTLPDGFHVFKQTNPLEIPLSFEVHAFDTEYCVNGPGTLLDVAASLHALALPILPESNVDLSLAAPATVSESEAGLQQKSDDSANGTDAPSFRTAKQPYYGPVACLLNLMIGSQNGPGVSCVGYVKSVSVKFRGPWLSDPNGPRFNMPSYASYDFVFVHNPGYTNAFAQNDFTSLTRTLQTGAQEIRRRFYNTQDLTNEAAQSGRISFQGLDAFTNS